MIRWVCFDVGETIFDETSFWGRWADWLGVPRVAFMSELGETIAAGRHHQDVFEHYRPGFDLAAAQAERLAAGDEPSFRPEDIFPDVRPCFAGLKAQGLKIGVAGNNTAVTEGAVARLGLPIDFIGSSARWGVAKPAPGFFTRLAVECRTEPRHIAYVGDRLDNDVLPAKRMGMTGVFLRRGLWARAHGSNSAAHEAHITIDTLDDLLPALPLRM